MKKKYETPEAKVCLFSKQDVLMDGSVELLGNDAEETEILWGETWDW